MAHLPPASPTHFISTLIWTSTNTKLFLHSNKHSPRPQTVFSINAAYQYMPGLQLVYKRVMIYDLLNLWLWFPHTSPHRVCKFPEEVIQLYYTWMSISIMRGSTVAPRTNCKQRHARLDPMTRIILKLYVVRKIVSENRRVQFDLNTMQFTYCCDSLVRYLYGNVILFVTNCSE